VKNIYCCSLVMVIALGGCATTRGVVDLNVEDEVSGTLERESRGKVFLGSIIDGRVFELKPQQPFIPSLKNGEITNSELKARAIARKRNTFGRAMGDIMLPEGRTVIDVVRENVKIALRNSGYEVVEAHSSDAEEIEIEINKFWSWFIPGFWALKIEFQSELEFQTELAGLRSDALVEGYAHQKHQAATEGAWLQTIGVGMDNLRANLESRLAEN